MSKFLCVTSTEDGRLTAGRVYQGGFIKLEGIGGLRIVVYDNTGQWMTFNPSAFKPVDAL